MRIGLFNRNFPQSQKFIPLQKLISALGVHKPTPQLPVGPGSVDRTDRQVYKQFIIKLSSEDIEYRQNEINRKSFLKKILFSNSPFINELLPFEVASNNCESFHGESKVTKFRVNFIFRSDAQMKFVHDRDEELTRNGFLR